MSEAQLIESLRKNEKVGYEYLYDHYSAALYKVIRTNIFDQDDADDILQEVFVKVWKNISQYDSKKGKLFTWMVNITRNLSIDKTRSKDFNNRQKNCSTDAIKSFINNVPSIATSIDHIGLIDVVNNLTHNEKFLIELAFFQGYTHSEISEEFTIPLGTVKSRLRTATQNLKGMLTEYAIA